ncbi:MAG TPA: hypothetical protein VF299_08665 [Mycobacterium sp.]
MNNVIRRVIGTAAAGVVIGIATPSAIAAADNDAVPGDGTMASAIVVLDSQPARVAPPQLPPPAQLPLPAPAPAIPSAPATQPPLARPGSTATPPVGLNTDARPQRRAGGVQSPIQMCPFLGIPC